MVTAMERKSSGGGREHSPRKGRSGRREAAGTAQHPQPGRQRGPIVQYQLERSVYHTVMTVVNRIQQEEAVSIAVFM